jgi:four helix bundle protein
MSDRVRTRHFRGLLVWQKSKVLVKGVYRATAGFPKEELFGLMSQMRRAAVSVPSNIAEGHGRLTDGNMGMFLGQARGSLFELETQIELARDLEFLNDEVMKELLGQCAEIARMLNGLLGVLEGRLADSLAC